MNTKNLKPFDLEAALKGEPVMLRDGSKAFVRHHETEQKVGDDFRLWGVFFTDLNTCTTTSWTAQGKWRDDERDYALDIIGMYQKTQMVNGFEVPAPETEKPEEGSVYYAPMPTNILLYQGALWSTCLTLNLRLLERGLVFLNKEDAIANAKAMLGIDPHEESEE